MNASARLVSPDPAPYAARARPKAFGRGIVLLAAKSAAALAPRPLLTAHCASATFVHSSVNRSTVSALARVVPPEAALPMVPSFISTHPVSATVLIVIFTSPVDQKVVVGSKAAVPRPSTFVPFPHFMPDVYAESAA